MNASNIIGNDIVDWYRAKQQLQKLRLRSLEKILNPFEIDYVNSHIDSLLAFWQLWSVKEAAYKAWQRLNNAKPVFNPMHFKCLEIMRHSVMVENDDFCCTVKTSYTNNHIYSRCHSEKFQSKVFDSEDSYKLWLSMMAQEKWIIKKSPFNIPEFVNTSSQKRLPISISHDGGYTAIVW